MRTTGQGEGLLDHGGLSAVRGPKHTRPGSAPNIPGGDEVERSVSPDACGNLHLGGSSFESRCTTRSSVVRVASEQRWARRRTNYEVWIAIPGGIKGGPRGTAGRSHAGDHFDLSAAHRSSASRVPSLPQQPRLPGSGRCCRGWARVDAHRVRVRVRGVVEPTIDDRLVNLVGEATSCSPAVRRCTVTVSPDDMLPRPGPES